MNIKFHNSENLEGNIILELLEEDYLPQVDQAMKKYRAKVDLKGFRKGQAPYTLVKKMYGPEILFQTVMDVVKKTLHDYLDNQKLSLWGNPLMTESSLYDSDIDFNNPGILTFKFEYGLIPPIDFKKLEEIKVDKYTIKHVSEATINEMITKAQLRYGTLKEVTQSEAGDTVHGVLINASGYRKAIYLPAESKINENDVVFLGLQPQNELTLQLKAGQTDISLKDTRAYKEPLEILQALTGEYQFIVEKISRPIPAELDSDFFSKVLGSEKVLTIESFKEELSNILINHTQMVADSIFDTDLKQVITQNLPFDLPENFIKKQLRANHPEWEENVVDSFFEYTRPNLRWNFFVDTFIEENKLEITVSEINSVMRTKFKNNPSIYEEGTLDEEELNKKVEKGFLKGEAAKPYKEAYDWILQKKTLDALRDQINIHTQEKTVEEFNQMLDELQQKNEVAPLPSN
ncbi:MAG: hypothetical protein BGO68_03590 [Candidatus Amoebophilus sp. 36-38]|nr:MAG: hypothetical protein BGO68_03590 [Candidatus Amoebophilus sp. 36-38]